MAGRGDRDTVSVAHVILGDDYYEHEYFRDVAGTTLSDYDKDRIFEIPVEKLVRWEDAEAAYRNMQAEVGDLLKRRGEDRNFARPTIPVKHYSGTWKPFPGLPPC